MKAARKSQEKQPIRIALVERDPLRSVGFRAIFEGEADFALKSFTPSSIFSARGFDVVLISSRTGSAMYDIMTGLKSLNPNVKIIATGNQRSEELALRALCAGAKGYIEESAPVDEFRQAIREVYGNGVWAPPQLLSQFIERITAIPRPPVGPGPLIFSDREREVLHLLVSGRSNKEIGAALAIEERTVKMHVASLMRKAGVANRIALSVHALTHSLLGVDLPD
jgi:DNA-binding NarL/FixJ family response regulator